MIFCFSASYKNTSLPLLESLNIKDEDTFAQTLISGETFRDCILLQTCHRTEIYCVPQIIDKGEAIKSVLKLWSTKTGVSNDIITQTARVYEEKDALSHLFNVASGLESMVLGEDQILGQVRLACVKAKKIGTAGPVLEKIFMKAINTGRRVRTQTRINEGSVSLSSAAVDLAARELGSLASARILVIGAGEAGTLAAEALKSNGASSIVIANRGYERSLELAKKVSGKAIAFNEIAEALPNVDLVIGAVSVVQPILNEKNITSAFAGNADQRKMLLIDLSQPRAFDERIGLLTGVHLKNIDDLQEAIAETLRQRQAEAEKSKVIISEELARLETELSRMIAQPLITEIFRRYEAIRQNELKRAIVKLGESDQKKLTVLDRFSRELVERIAYIPIEQLKKAALSSDGQLLSAAEQLFQTKS